MVNGKPAELVRALVPMENAQPSELPDLVYIFRVSPVAPALHSPTLHHMPSCCRLQDFDEVGVAIAHDPTVCQNQTYLGHEVLRQVHLIFREGCLSLISSNSIRGAAYIGCRVLTLRRVVAASARGNFPSLWKEAPAGSPKPGK